MKALLILKDLPDGSFTQIPEVTLLRSSMLAADSSQGLLVEADGELLGEAKSARIEVLPKAIRAISAAVASNQTDP